jgi:aryl-alcohol dehydrogenase-like predicted oxidoreductase
MTDPKSPTPAVTPSDFAIGGTHRVPRLGFGCMRLTGQPGNFGPYRDWEGGKAVLRRALELGVRFFDTAHAYGPGHNEDLVADALHPYPSDVVVASKAGIEKSSATEVRLSGKPEALRARLEESLRRLRLEAVTLYYLHVPDPQVPFEESVGELLRQREAGKIVHVGISNVTLEQLDSALRLGPIAAVQNRYNIAERDGEAVLDRCREKGIAFVPYAPFGANPRAYGAPLTRGEPDASGLSPAQRSLRTLLDHAENVLPIPGTTSIAHLEENARAFFGG